MRAASAPSTAEQAVLILAPIGRDAELTGSLLQSHNIDCITCRSTDELLDRMAQGSGPVIAAEEAFDEETVERLFDFVHNQPSWSDLPLVIFGTRQKRIARLAAQTAWYSVTILPRPVQVPTFLSMIRAAVEARRKQFELRDLVRDLERVNHHLQERTTQLRRLTVQLTKTEQSERRRIATEIHDYLAQLLVVGRLKLRQASRMRPTDDIATLLQDLDGLFDQSLSYTRTLVAELSPQVLYHAGLPAALKWLGEHMAQHGLTVTVQLERDTVPVPEDHGTLLYQAVRELLFNVIKHAGVDRATLTVSGTDETLEVSVRDQGKGFEPGHALRPPESMHYGLFSIRERVMALQGSFQIESASGQGTKATIVLPIPAEKTCESHSTVALSQTDTSTGEAKVRRVLIVDDHTIMREGLRTLLEAYPDLEVVGEATNGIEAIDQAQRLRPDVVIMDVNMPRMNGVTATREIHRQYPEIKVVGLSYDSSTYSVMTEAGAVTQVDKSDAVGQLYRAVCDALDGKDPSASPVMQPSG